MQEWMCRRNLFACALGLALSSYLVSVSPALAQPRPAEKQQREVPPPPPMDPHGAVLCVWYIYLEIKAVGDRCFRDDASEFPKLLNEAIEQLDTFIVENAPIARPELEAAKAKYLGSRNPVCRPDSKNGQLQMYEHLRDSINRDVAGFRASLAKLLAVPRKPVMNPCL